MALQFRFSLWRLIALWIAPHIDNYRRCHLRARVVTLTDSVGPRDVTLGQKISAAVYIVAHGVNGSGVSTWATLMHPMREFNLDDVSNEASRLLSDVVRASLDCVPQSRIDQILINQAERFSSDYV